MSGLATSREIYCGLPSEDGGFLWVEPRKNAYLSPTIFSASVGCIPWEFESKGCDPCSVRFADDRVHLQGQVETRSGTELPGSKSFFYSPLSQRSVHYSEFLILMLVISLVTLFILVYIL